jgi:hypothetical protein
MKLGPTGLSTEELGRLLFGLSQCKRTALPVFISAASRMNAVGELENCSDNDFANLVQAIGAQTLFLATEKVSTQFCRTPLYNSFTDIVDRPRVDEGPLLGGPYLVSHLE